MAGVPGQVPGTASGRRRANCLPSAAPRPARRSVPPGRRAAFEVSYQLLADGDARLFRLLGLHPGPDFDTATAAALAGIEVEAAGPVLDRLVLAHLVTEDGADRFGMHDLLRLFARDACQLADRQATRDAAEARLVAHYADRAGFLESCVNPRLRPAAGQAGVPLPSMREALAMLETERANLLAALGLAAQRGWDQRVVQLAERIGEWLGLLRYPDDLLTIENAALVAARHAGDTAAESRALTNLGIAHRKLRRFEEAIGRYQDALASWREAGNRHGEGQTLTNLGLAYQELGRFEEAIGCHQESLAIRREAGDRNGEGQTLNNLGSAYGSMGWLEEAIGCHQESLTICREAGDRHGGGAALANLGVAYEELGRFEEAIGCYQESLTIFREAGDRYGEGQTLTNLGLAYQKLRQPDRAAACWRDAAAAMRDAGDHEQAAHLEQRAASARSRRRRWRPSS